MRPKSYPFRLFPWKVGGKVPFWATFIKVLYAKTFPPLRPNPLLSLIIASVCVCVEGWGGVRWCRLQPTERNYFGWTELDLFFSFFPCDFWCGRTTTLSTGDLFSFTFFSPPPPTPSSPYPHFASICAKDKRFGINNRRPVGGDINEHLPVETTFPGVCYVCVSFYLFFFSFSHLGLAKQGRRRRGAEVTFIYAPQFRAAQVDQSVKRWKRKKLASQIWREILLERAKTSLDGAEKSLQCWKTGE